MSVVRYPESMNSTDLQIWDNAAFDNGESEDSSAMFKSSWPHLKPVVFSSTESLDSFSSKENQNPLLENNRLAIKSHLPSKSIHQQKGRVKSTKTQSSKSKTGNEEDVRDDGKNIDLEIEEIEKEISRLSSRLEALRIEKAEKCVKTAERRAGGGGGGGGGGGRVVPAKFMEQKQTGKIGEEKKKVEEAFIMSSKVQTRRRGLSIGPSEIINGGSGARRGGMSLGPVEISAGAIAIAAGKQQESAITPIQAIQNRRKSCFWKLQDIEEEEEGKKMITTTKERRKSCFLSISPKSRKPNYNISAAKILQASRKAATTVGSRKTVKREDLIVNSIQPKKLFINKDGEKSSVAAATNKKPLKLPGRIVASRYNNNNQGTNQASAMRKRSLPENNNDQEEDESKRFDKKRSLSVGKSRPTPTQPEIKNSAAATEGRVKKRWQIPSPPPTAATTVISSVVPDLLPSIRTTRCLIETPRDSGPAKRVADLVGRKSYFSIDEELVCQALDFAEEEEK